MIPTGALRSFLTAAFTEAPSISQFGAYTTQSRWYTVRSTAVHRPVLCSASRQDKIRALPLHSQVGAMSTITDSEWNDVKSALIGLISSIRRADGPSWADAFKMSKHYLEVRVPTE